MLTDLNRNNTKKKHGVFSYKFEFGNGMVVRKFIGTQGFLLQAWIHPV